MTREFCGRHGQPLRTARRAAWPRGLVTVPGLALEPRPGVSVQRPLRRPGGRGSAGGGDGRDGRTTGGDRKGLGGGRIVEYQRAGDPQTPRHRDAPQPRCDSWSPAASRSRHVRPQHSRTDFGGTPSGECGASASRPAPLCDLFSWPSQRRIESQCTCNGERAWRSRSRPAALAARSALRSHTVPFGHGQRESVHVEK